MMYQYWKTNELCHSGVKGMKWGIRKKINQAAAEHEAVACLGIDI